MGYSAVEIAILGNHAIEHIRDLAARWCSRTDRLFGASFGKSRWHRLCEMDRASCLPHRMPDGDTCRMMPLIWTAVQSIAGKSVLAASNTRANSVPARTIASTPSRSIRRCARRRSASQLIIPIIARFDPRSSQNRAPPRHGWRSCRTSGGRCRRGRSTYRFRCSRE